MLAAINQYLSAIDAASPTADDRTVSALRKGSIKINSAALLMCSPGWCERHSRKDHVDFLEQRCDECTVLNVGQSVL